VVEGTANIRQAVFSHLQRLPLGYHEVHHSGNALSILSNDISAAEKAYQEDLLVLVESTAMGLGAVIFMLVLNWQLALLVLVSGMLPLIVNTLFAGTLRKIGDEVQGNLGGLSERMTDLLAGYQVIRTFNLGDWILERFEKANGMVLDSSMRRVRTEANLAAANDFTGFFNFIPIVVGCYLVMNGHTTFGVLIGIIQVSNQVNYFVYSLGGTISRIQAALAAADRILKMIDEPLEPECYALLEPGQARSTRPEVEGHAAIEFTQVKFAYNGGSNVLDGLSLQIQPGQMVAFAGPSGGGKSTLFKLLLGCYPLKDGAIRLGGTELSRLRLKDLREQIAYVPQDAYLFAGTIYDNIRFGKVDARDAEIYAAAKAAFADEFIREFPAGYETVVGERGARLSGGQRQRIAIARALLRNAPILLLDEATSALDSESEHLVQQALEVLMRGRTTLVIAHRLSTISSAEQIYVVDRGQVVEQGRHEELLSQKGIYANLVDLQFQVRSATL
jgi:ATP-binding cassette subfamily B protein